MDHAPRAMADLDANGDIRDCQDRRKLAAIEGGYLSLYNRQAGRCAYFLLEHETMRLMNQRVELSLQQQRLDIARALLSGKLPCDTREPV